MDDFGPVAADHVLLAQETHPPDGTRLAGDLVADRAQRIAGFEEAGRRHQYVDIAGRLHEMIAIEQMLLERPLEEDEIDTAVAQRLVDGHRIHDAGRVHRNRAPAIGVEPFEQPRRRLACRWARQRLQHEGRDLVQPGDVANIGNGDGRRRRSCRGSPRRRRTAAGTPAHRPLRRRSRRRATFRRSLPARPYAAASPQKILPGALYCKCEAKHRQIHAPRPVFPSASIFLQPGRLADCRSRQRMKGDHIETRSSIAGTLATILYEFSRA